MEPITVITTAMALAEATGLSSWIGRKLGGEVGEKTAEKITDIAGVITGTEDPSEMLAKIKKDQALANELKKQLIDNEQELKLAYFEDVKSARDMYKATDHKQADSIADGIIKYNLWFVLFLILINIGVILFVKEVAIVALLSNLIGASISYLWNERSTVINFFFGSSLGSKDKSRELLKHTDAMKPLKPHDK